MCSNHLPFAETMWLSEIMDNKPHNKKVTQILVRTLGGSNNLSILRYQPLARVKNAEKLHHFLWWVWSSPILHKNDWIRIIVRFLTENWHEPSLKKLQVMVRFDSGGVTRITFKKERPKQHAIADSIWHFFEAIKCLNWQVVFFLHTSDDFCENSQSLTDGNVLHRWRWCSGVTFLVLPCKGLNEDFCYVVLCFNRHHMSLVKTHALQK